MAGIGIQPHIIEAVLNHIRGHKGGIAGNDGKRYEDFLGGKLHVRGEGKSERYWIELPSQTKWRNYFVPD
jgi:hypothetical protein